MWEGCKNDIVSVVQEVLGKKEITRRTNRYHKKCSKGTLDKNEAHRHMISGRGTRNLMDEYRKKWIEKKKGFTG